MRLLIFFITFLSLLTYAQEKPSMMQTHIPNITIEELGVPIRALAYLNPFVLDEGRAPLGRICVGTFSSRQGRVVIYDVETGQTDYYDAKPFKSPEGEIFEDGGSGFWGVVQYDDSTVYAATTINANFYKLNLKTNEWTFLGFPFRAKVKADKSDLENGESYVWQMRKGLDGKIYGGTWPNGKLVSYNPANGEFENYGSMQPGEQYCLGICAEFPGKVFCGIGAHAQIVELDLKTRTRRALLPERFQKEYEAPWFLLRVGDYLVGVVYPKVTILVIDPTTGAIVRETTVPDGSTDYQRGSAHGVTRVGADIYFTTLPGDILYRYNVPTGTLTKIRQNIGGPIGVLKNRYLYCRAASKKMTVLDLQENKILKQVHTNFTGNDGMGIFTMNCGPDGNVYGGSFINQHLFRYEPKTKRLTDLGVSLSIGGQVNSVLPFNDKLYIGHYVQAILTEYDPKQPWNPTPTDSNPNPRIVGATGHEQDRIYEMALGTDKKIYYGTYPAKGRIGGCFVIFDPVTEKFEVHENFIHNQSIRAVEASPDGLIFLGSHKTLNLGVTDIQE
jgi:outer membrane protein assembly factor BamB